MDSDYTYQSQYIWKQTAADGLLPVTNFTEEINESVLRKRGKDKDKGKEIGTITDFTSNEEEEAGAAKNKHFSNGFYVYVSSKGQYGIIRQKKSDNIFVVKVKNR